MYLVRFFDSMGRSMDKELDHFPTQADTPEWAVRADIALPYST